MSVKLFLLAALVAYASAQECYGCTGSSTTGCPTGFQAGCCNSKCVATQNTVDYGGTCAQTGCNQCKSPYTCNSDNVCVMPLKSYNCACSAGECATGMSCNSGFCGFTGIGVGGSCAAPNTCASGLSCVASVCTAVPVGSTCSQSYSLIPGADAASNCVATAYCNATIFDSSNYNYTCVTKLVNGTPIPMSACTSGVSNWCASGYCYKSAAAAPFTIVCAAFNPGPATTGQYCISNGQCASGFCDLVSGRPNTYLTCRAANTLALYDTCTNDGSTTQCPAGSYCSYNNTLAAPKYNCLSGTKYGLSAGSACYSDDQCFPLSNKGHATGYQRACFGSNADIGGGNGVQGQCNSTVVGVSCSVDVAALYCNPNQAATTTCTCANAAWTCTANPSTTGVCTSNAATISALVGTGPTNRYPSMQSILAAGAAADRAAYIAYACCTSCTNGLSSAATTATLGSGPTYWNQVLNCATLTSAAYGTTDETARCVNPRVKTWTAANLFGTCTSGNTSAGAAVFPSVALLVAVVAVVLSIFA